MPSPIPDVPAAAMIDDSRAISEGLDALRRQIEKFSKSTFDEMNARKEDLQKLANKIWALTEKIDALRKKKHQLQHMR